MLKKTGVVKVSNGFDGGKLFDFNSIENSTLEKLISELSSQSSPGVSSIHAKVIKSASKT